ncbi:MAG: hypothetical protein VYD92_06780 [Pseudomonadota bacterium]|nr:hypothetical protein [Pseudomonadota bacterium]
MNKIKIGLLMVLIAIISACVVSIPSGVGTWDTSRDTPQGEREAVLMLLEDGTGSWDGVQGEVLLSGILFEENSVNFEINASGQGQNISLSFSAIIDGSSLDGELGTPFGIAVPVSGSRR